MSLFFLIFILPLNLFENVKSVDNFAAFTHHEYRNMNKIKEWVESIWRSSLSDFTDDAARKDFEMILCGKPESNVRGFYERFIDGHSAPEVMNGDEIWEPRDFLDTDMTVERTVNSMNDYHVDVMKNGKRIGLEFWPTTKYFSGRMYQLRRAIIYTCEDYYGVTFRNYAPTFKAQKLLNHVWQLATINRLFQGERQHFSLDHFTFEICSGIIGYSPYNSIQYLTKQFLTKENYMIKPYVMDAIVMKKDKKWQASVKWGDKYLQFQLENIYDKILVTKGREWPCQGANWK